jgi:hypothetical protein
MVNKTTAMTIVLPLLPHAHCTAALPISVGDCLGDIGICCIDSPAMTVPRNLEL